MHKQSTSSPQGSFCGASTLRLARERWPGGGNANGFALMTFAAGDGAIKALGETFISKRLNSCSSSAFRFSRIAIDRSSALSVLPQFEFQGSHSRSSISLFRVLLQLIL
jgi:hypothetical protein